MKFWLALLLLVIVLSSLANGEMEEAECAVKIEQGTGVDVVTAHEYCEEYGL